MTNHDYKILFVFIFLLILIETITFKHFYESQKYQDNHKVASVLIAHNNKTTNKTTTNVDIDNKSYHKRYQFLSKCDIEYHSQTKPDEPLEPELYEKRVARAVLFYYPLNDERFYMKELRWAYRSWTEMQKYEPAKWRTDLVIFLDNKKKSERYKNFEELGCSFRNVRLSAMDKPMCCLVAFTPMTERNQSYDSMKFASVYEEYEYLYEKLDIFNHKEEQLYPFYKKLKTLDHYNYVDSILMAFEGYNYFKDKYQYLVRSDIDIFLTPLFSKWLPKNCNDFVVGGGGYNNDFNVRKLGRIASYLKLNYTGVRNVGSTWYSTPVQFCVVSYLTLVSMAYLSNEEFSSVERNSKLGTINWPEWHYGVLLLYGQNLAMNHLIATNQTNVVIYSELIDFSSGRVADVHKVVHMHVYHGREIFSKFNFYDGVYENATVSPENLNKTNYYCLHLALESKRLNASGLLDLANIESAKKS